MKAANDCGTGENAVTKETGGQMGRAVGKFYKELVDSGFPEAEALKMSKDYLRTIISVASNFKDN